MKEEEEMPSWWRRHWKSVGLVALAAAYYVFFVRDD